MALTIKKEDPSSLGNVTEGKVSIFCDTTSGQIKYKDSSASIFTLQTGGTGAVADNNSSSFYIPDLKYCENTSANMPFTMRGATLFNVSGTLYIVGGLSGSNVALNTILTASVSEPTNFGVAVGVVPAGLFAAQYFIVGDKAYLIGGRNETTVKNTILSASINDLTAWSDTGATIPTAMQSSLTPTNFAIIKEKAYIFGGTTGTGLAGASNIIMSASIENMLDWGTASETLPAAQVNHHTIVTEDSVYLVGGFTNSGTAKNTIYYSSINDPTVFYLSAQTLPAGVAGGNVFIIDDGIYLFSGFGPGASIQPSIFRATIDDPINFSSIAGYSEYKITQNCNVIIDGTVYFFGGMDGSTLGTIGKTKFSGSANTLVDMSVVSTHTDIPSLTKKGKISYYTSQQRLGVLPWFIYNNDTSPIDTLW